jgi:hypothetical protein
MIKFIYTKVMKRALVFLYLLSSLAVAGSGCKQTRKFWLFSKLTSDKALTQELFRIMSKACAGKIKPNSMVYYSNRQVLTYKFGDPNALWWYPNGKIFAYGIDKVGALWSYANGKIASLQAQQLGGTWYHENGQIAVLNAGQPYQQYSDERGNYFDLSGAFPLSFLNESKTELDMENFLFHLHATKIGINFTPRSLMIPQF